MVWSALRIGPRATNHETEEEHQRGNQDRAGNLVWQEVGLFAKRAVPLMRVWFGCLGCLLVRLLVKLEPNNTEHGVQCWLVAVERRRSIPPLPSMSRNELSPVYLRQGCAGAAQGPSMCAVALGHCGGHARPVAGIPVSGPLRNTVRHAMTPGASPRQNSPLLPNGTGRLGRAQQTPAAAHTSSNTEYLGRIESLELPTTCPLPQADKQTTTAPTAPPSPPPDSSPT
jgi:hypothetical protein